MSDRQTARQTARPLQSRLEREIERERRERERSDEEKAGLLAEDELRSKDARERGSSGIHRLRPR
jgi:hypothetical protein